MAKENTKNVAHAAQALFFAHSLTTHPDSNLKIDHVLRLPGFDVSSTWTRGLLTLFEPPVHLFSDFAKGFRGPALTDVLLSPQNPGQILSLPEEWFSHPHAADALRAATACANIECQAPHTVVSAAARARREDIAHWLIFPQAAARGYTTKGTGLRAALLRRGGLRVIPDEGKIMDELRRVVPAADVIQLETLSFAGQVARMRSKAAEQAGAPPIGSEAMASPSQVCVIASCRYCKEMPSARSSWMLRRTSMRSGSLNTQPVSRRSR